MKQKLTENIFEFLSKHSVVTVDELRKVSNLIGPDWFKLADYCEIRNEGYKYYEDKTQKGDKMKAKPNNKS